MFEERNIILCLFFVYIKTHNFVFKATLWERITQKTG